MDKLRITLVLFVCGMAGFVSCTGKGQQPVAPEAVQPFVQTSQNELNANPDSYLNRTYVKHIVVLKPGVPQQVRDSIEASLDKPASHLYNTVFIGFAADISQTEFDALSADGRVAYVEEDVLMQHCAPLLENNPGSDPWGSVDNLVPTRAAAPVEGPIRFEGDNPVDWGVSRINAFPSPGLKGAGITVAIIDTGIDTDHPDLAGSLVAEYDAVNDVEGAGTAEDLHGHGTHVAGIVGARDNDIGTVGVAPECSFAAIKVFAGASGSGPDSDLIRGIDWMAANHNVVIPPIKVANMSLSGTGTSRAMYDAIQACNDLGITTVVAAGNDFRDASQQLPARFDNVITVSAMKRVWNGIAYDYKFATFSNWGNVVDLIAPGQSILSLRNNGATRYMSGTSMACPHVAGAAALYLDENLGDGFQETYDALVGSGETGTWDGDPDGVSEPLVDVRELGWHMQTLASTGSVGYSTSLFVVNGNPAISYMDMTNGDLKFVRATNAAGSSWGTLQTPDSIDYVGMYTSLAVVDGNPSISYYDATNGDLKFVRATNTDGSSWGTPQILDSTGDVGRDTSLEVVDGNPAISFRDETNEDLKYIRATNADGSIWGTPQTLDSTGNVGEYTSLAVVDSNPAISYYDFTNSDLKYVRATNADGSSWGTPQALDSTGNVGWHTSLAVVDGNPAISYLDGTNEDLKYVQATNAAGSIWGTPQTLDSIGQVGYYTSLAVVNGNPAISYHAMTNFDLKYVRATNADGSIWAAPQILDSTVSVGWFTSLAVVDGNPAISYYDYSNRDLKFAYFGR